MLKSKAKVAPNIKFLTKSQSESNILTKTFRSIFIFAQIVFALDYGFLETRSIKRSVFKCIALLQTSITSGYVLYILFTVKTDLFVWFILDVIIYVMFVIVTISCKYTYFEFQMDLIAFDKEIKADTPSFRYELKFILFCLAIYLFTIVNSVLFFIYVPDDSYTNSVILNFLWHLVVFSVDFVRITYVFLFCSSYWRICEFITFVKNDSSNIIACQYLYKNIADITEKAKSNYNFMFVVTLMYNTATVTINLFIPFSNNSVKNLAIMQLVSDVMMVVKNIFVMFAPTFTAGLLAAEVEKLVLTLRDKVLIAKEEKLRKDIRRFISYIEARSMKFTVYNVIPLDWNLPIRVINLAITYLIVMIQFNYKS